MRFSRAAIIVVSLGLVAISGTHAQTPTQQQDVDQQASRMFDQVMSPFCPGRTLTNCPSPQADILRDGIKERLRAGATADQIWDELYAAYGDQVRSVPRASGFNLLAWIIPGLFFALGALLLIRWMRPRWRGTPTAPMPEQQLDPELEARLQSEMAELRSVT